MGAKDHPQARAPQVGRNIAMSSLSVPSLAFVNGPFQARARYVYACISCG